MAMRSLPNAKNMGEFHGYNGDCGQDLETGFLHIVKGAPLTGAELDLIVKRDIAHGWASANGSEPIGSIVNDLTQLAFVPNVTNYGFSNPARFDWKGALQQWGGIKPIGFEVARAGVLEGNNVQFHFIGCVAWDPSALVGEFFDGDHANADSGVLVHYTLAQLEAAAICGMFIINWTAPVVTAPVVSARGGSVMATPTGWKDNATAGELTALNGVKLKHGFRFMVLTNAGRPGVWDAADVPLAGESYPAHVLESDPKSPTGAIILMSKSGKWYWTDTFHKANDVAELAATMASRDTFARQAELDSQTIAALNTQVTQAQHAASASDAWMQTIKPLAQQVVSDLTSLLTAK